MALVENGSMLVTISSDGIMLMSNINLLVKGMPIGHRPMLELPPVYLMRQSDLAAMDDRISELKNQVGDPRVWTGVPWMPGSQRLCWSCLLCAS